MRVLVNGEPRQLEPGATVEKLVATLLASDRGVAVALDGEVVPRGSWPTTHLHDGARIEVLVAVQGG